ncbi:MAG: flavoprotein [Gemmataceae bacterium]
MANVLLGATGSVAAVRVPALVDAFRAAGHQVRVVATDPAPYFFDPSPLRDILTLDADEWPGERYTRGDPVRHIELRDWANLFVIAPLDANTLAKLAVGLCDNCLTCVWRAWPAGKPVVLAPAMNTVMWESRFTGRHLRAIAADFGAGHIPGHLELDALLTHVNDRAAGLRVVPPISKRLACGDVGVGAMAEVPEVVAAAADQIGRIELPPNP